MNDVLTDEMYENFKMYFPSVSREVIECYKNDDYSLVLVTSRDALFYDDFEHTIRVLPRNRQDMTEEECRTEFSMRLRRLLYLKGLTQIELAERTGIQRTQLTRYILGKSSPSFYNLDKISRAIGCSMDELRYI